MAGLERIFESKCTTQTKQQVGAVEDDHSNETFLKEINQRNDLDIDAEPFTSDIDNLSEGEVTANGSNTESVEINEQSENLAGATASEKKKGGYKYDILILHSPFDEGCVDEMKKIIRDEVKLPDVKMASTEDDIPAGSNIFTAFNDLMDVSRSLLLFITQHFYGDCLSRYRMHTQLVSHFEKGDCIIPVLFGEDEIRKQLREITPLKKAIFFQDKTDPKCKAFVKTITTTLQQCRTDRK
ncbi:uncharacterized protein LOC143042035 [Mytilus galloprovincialis]|uniref:uncharacterized protein LOC143042035 n=1 Tax=Mytilus galloprovincialis TaxID=29158 RepID=UPI003F7BCF1D